VIRATETTEMVPGAAAKRVKTVVRRALDHQCGFLWFIVVLTRSASSASTSSESSPAPASSASPSGLARSICARLGERLFLILENQIRVGDLAIINGTAGLVEAVTFQTIVLRDQKPAWFYVFSQRRDQHARQRHPGLVGLCHR